jgi:hypothetical protein
MKKMGVIILMSTMVFFLLHSSTEAYNQPLLINNGLTNILDGAAPPPGLYFSPYILFYTSSDVLDHKGHELNLPSHVDVNVMGLVPQLIWVSKYNLLGGNFGVNGAVAVANLDLDAPQTPFVAHDGGIADGWIGPFVAWHKPLGERSSFHWVLDLDIIFPSGRYSEEAQLNVGRNHWTFEPWFAFTLLLPYDFEVTSRIQFAWHTTNDDYFFDTNLVPTPGRHDMRPGSLFHFNYTVAKGITKNLKVGLVGYFLDQMCKTKWDGQKVPANSLLSNERAFAAGPAIRYDWGRFNLEAKSMFEAAVRNRFRGTAHVLRAILVF